MSKQQFKEFILTPLISSLLGWLFSMGLIYFIRIYGLMLFLGIPIFIGLFSAVLLHIFNSNSYPKNIAIALLSGFLCGLYFLSFGQEGFICLFMFLPLGIPLLIFGSIAGTFLCQDTSPKKISTVIIIFIPLLLTAEITFKTKPPTRKVITSVTVEGNIQDVWNKVVEFPEIQSEPKGILRFGIAYPIRARIDGVGENAIRYCEFNTGSFVEPITRWEEPTLLTFDVSENPSPMTELSLYTHVDPPHLHGYMVSEKGQFQLQEREDGSVLLTGTTWYHHDLQPNFYWGPISDAIIHQIHNRVLNHIKKEVEKDIRQVAYTQ